MRGALDAIRVTELAGLEGHSILILSPAVWCTITIIAISYGPYYFIGVRSSAHLTILLKRIRAELLLFLLEFKLVIIMLYRC